MRRIRFSPDAEDTHYRQIAALRRGADSRDHRLRVGALAGMAFSRFVRRARNAAMGTARPGANDACDDARQVRDAGVFWQDARHYRHTASCADARSIVAGAVETSGRALLIAAGSDGSLFGSAPLQPWRSEVRRYKCGQPAGRYRYET